MSVGHPAAGRAAGGGVSGGDDPQVVGAYRLSGRLGAGGMGAVYLGEDPAGRVVAVKVIRRELALDGAFRARFADEVANARRVASFCTARVLDHGEDDGLPYMVTEYIEGDSLDSLIKEEGALDPGRLHGLAVGIAAALTAIHAVRLVHRDLKPANVLISDTGPRVIDFGIARALDSTEQHTQTGFVVGSPGWIAPEQVFDGAVGTAADVFAWGTLVACAATGDHPFGKGNMLVLASRAKQRRHELGGVPNSLQPLVHAALDPDPDARPSAEDLLVALVGGADDPETAASEIVSSEWATAPPAAAPGARMAAPPPAPLPPPATAPPGPLPGTAPGTAASAAFPAAPVMPGTRSGRQASRPSRLLLIAAAAVFLIGAVPIAGAGIVWVVRSNDQGTRTLGPADTGPFTSVPDPCGLLPPGTRTKFQTPAQGRKATINGVFSGGTSASCRWNRPQSIRTGKGMRKVTVRTTLVVPPNKGGAHLALGRDKLAKLSHARAGFTFGTLNGVGDKAYLLSGITKPPSGEAIAGVRHRNVLIQVSFQGTDVIKNAQGRFHTVAVPRAKASELTKQAAMDVVRALEDCGTCRG